MTRKGVWDLQQTRDKYLQSLWSNDMVMTAWGYGFYGTRGDNSGGNPSGNTSSPVQIPGANWSSIGGKISYSSDYFWIQSKTDGTLWAWGRNDKGQLGHNSLVNYSSPVQIPGTTWSNKITMGRHSASAIKTDGTLWTWGHGYYGLLGQNNASNKVSSPVQIPGTTWSRAYIGNRSSGGVKTDGTLWMWGSNAYGQLGQNSILDSPAWVGISSPVQVGSDTTWSVVHVGDKNVAAVKTDGTLWVWGYNNDGRLGDLTATTSRSSPKQIPGTTWKQFTWVNYGGWQAVKTDGTLWVAGRANYGQAGHEYSGDRSSPVQVGSDARWDSVGSWAYGTTALRSTLTPSQL